VVGGFWRRLVHGYWQLHQRPDWSLFAGANWPERIMQVIVSDRLHTKQGRSIARWTLSHGGRKLVVFLKRHYRLPRWSGFLALIWPGRGRSPALQEWEHLAWARSQGLPVPNVEAAGEKIGPWGRLQSFIAVEELTGMSALHEAIPAAADRLDPTLFQQWKRGLAFELARLVRGLHDQNRFHKDLYLCHFYIADADTHRLPEWRGRVCMIDFHRLGHHPVTRRWWQAKDFGQLLYSTNVRGLTDRDRLQFWHCYFGQESKARKPRWLWWLVRMRARRYQDLNQDRPAPSRAA